VLDRTKGSLPDHRRLTQTSPGRAVRPRPGGFAFGARSATPCYFPCSQGADAKVTRLEWPREQGAKSDDERCFPALGEQGVRARRRLTCGLFGPIAGGNQLALARK
jgi:hypothetical protein